ncbi:MAG: AEC family transporter [Thermodesulfobacteriota bacterium]
MPITEVIYVVFPVFCTIAVGFLFARVKKIDLDPVLNLLLYITIPALIVSSLSHKKILISDLATVWGSVVLVAATSGLIAYAYLRITKRTELRGLYLTSMFMNSGNMALPLALLAFGADALSIAVLYYIAVSLLVYSVGVFICKGRGGFKEIFRLPLIYAATLALTCNLTDTMLPGPILETVDMIGAATIPLMQLCLGYRLFSTKLSNLNISIAGSVIRIGGGVLAAYSVVTLLGIEGLNRNVIILSSSMPAAVINFVMSHKYQLNSELVASTIALSTIISIFTTPLLLLWLMN